MVEMSTYGSERARADNPPGLLEVLEGLRTGFIVLALELNTGS